MYGQYMQPSISLLGTKAGGGLNVSAVPSRPRLALGMLLILSRHMPLLLVLKEKFQGLSGPWTLLRLVIQSVRV